ncbi:hypothetical protein ABKV19_011446 [Rosa sericea]
MACQSSIEEVKEAYDNVSSTRNSEAQAPDSLEFIKIRYAYELLTNPSWQRNYDIFGFEEQIDVIEKLKKQYAGESFSRIDLPLLESAASDSEDHNLSVITSKDFQTMFQDNKPWLIQLCSFGSKSCDQFSHAWKRIAGFLDGVANAAQVDLEVIQLATYLADRKPTGQPFFRNGLPSFVAFPQGCKSAKCLIRYEEDPSFDSVTDWFATTILGLPRILYYSKESLFAVQAGTFKEDDQIDLPPGFRFHPTDEELISHYLHKKVIDSNFSCKAIGDVDLNKSEPWDLPYKVKMGEKEWYFFCVRDRKYPTGLRTNRATEAGYWKATGNDKEIYKGKSLVGMKKTLVFYRGRAPKGSLKNLLVVKKIHITGLVSLGSHGTEMRSSGLPPLLDTAPYNGAKTRPASESNYVPCFSNHESIDSQRNQGIVDYINGNPLFSVSSNPSNNNAFPRVTYQNSLYSAPVSSGNF